MHSLMTAKYSDHSLAGPGEYWEEECGNVQWVGQWEGSMSFFTLYSLQRTHPNHSYWDISEKRVPTFLEKYHLGHRMHIKNSLLVVVETPSFAEIN